MSYATDKIRARYDDKNPSALRTDLFDALDEIDRLYADKQQEPWPLFTRTVYTPEKLVERINAIEALGLTNYIITRDVETRKMLTGMSDTETRSRWIIKVYGTEEETK